MDVSNLPQKTTQSYRRILPFLPLVAAVALGVVYFAVIPHFQQVTHLKGPLSTPSLKELAKKKGIELGNHAIYVRVNEPAYDEILKTQHDFVILDNSPNWHFNGYDLRPAKDKYDFSQLDYLMNYAEKRSMPVRLQHLLWGEEKWLPNWLTNGHYTKEQLDKIIDDHIQTVMSRYKGRIREYTVVNEAFTRGEHLYNLRDWWADATGSREYIDRAFMDARAADPNAVLILNDFGNDTKNSVSDAMYDYIKDAKARGVPIDGIGMQMHIGGANPPKKEDVIWNMNRFAELGVKVYVTELDVNMADVKGTYDEKAEKQGVIYHDMMRACIESTDCRSFTMLGITDKETWYNYMNLHEPMPLMFNERYEPKPAYYGLRAALSEE
jgi:endo-1,4-beta-xylanase